MSTPAKEAMCDTAQCLQSLQHHLADAVRNGIPGWTKRSQQVPSNISSAHAAVSLAEVATPGQRERLRLAFTAICCWEGGTPGSCTLTQWLLFLRAAGLLERSYHVASARHTFLTQVGRGAVTVADCTHTDDNSSSSSTCSTSTSARLSFQAWLSGLSYAAAALLPDTEEPERLGLLVNWLISHPALQSNTDTPTLCTALTPLTHPVSTPSIHTPADAALLQLLTNKAVQQAGSPAFKAAANALFLQYSVPWADACELDITSTCFSSHLVTSRAAHSASCNFVPPQMAVSAIGLKQLLRDCQLVPQHLTLQQAWAAADLSRPAAWRTGTPAHPDPLTYSAFVEWLGRIALIAFQGQSASRQHNWQQAAGGQQDSKPSQAEVTYNAAAKLCWQKRIYIAVQDVGLAPTHHQVNEKGCSITDSSINSSSGNSDRTLKTSPKVSSRSANSVAMLKVPAPTGPATACRAHWPAGSTAARTCSTAHKSDLAGGECEAAHHSHGSATILSSRPPFQQRTRGGWGHSNPQQQEEEEARQHQEVLAAAEEAAASEIAKLQQQVLRRWKLLQQHERAKSARQALQQAAGQAVADS